MLNPSTDKAYRHIRKRILTGHYGQGESLATKRLAEIIGISRTPVRDALRQLEKDGLVELSPRHEARVKAVSMEEFWEICELRKALETHAAALAAALHTARDLAVMRNCLHLMRGLIDKMSDRDLMEDTDDTDFWRDLGDQDVAFHMAIMNAAHNKLLKEEALRINVIHNLVSLPKVYRRIYKHEENHAHARTHPAIVWERHQDIYEAIARKDPEASRKAMAEHLGRSMERQIAHMREHYINDRDCHKSGKHAMS